MVKVVAAVVAVVAVTAGWGWVAAHALRS
jgi:hypothetical protein